MTAPRVPTQEEIDALYERYAKPLESDHWGEYVAVSPRGQVSIGSSILEAVQTARSTVGAGNMVFKVGQRTVGRWRSPRSAGRRECSRGSFPDDE